MLVIIGDLEVNLPVFTVDLFYIKHAEYNWKKPLLLKKKNKRKTQPHLADVDMGHHCYGYYQILCGFP